MVRYIHKLPVEAVAVMVVVGGGGARSRWLYEGMLSVHEAAVIATSRCHGKTRRQWQQPLSLFTCPKHIKTAISARLLYL